MLRNTQLNICLLALWVFVAAGSAAPVAERSIFEIDFDDHALGPWTQYGVETLNLPGFASIVEDASAPGNRYAEHRPDFSQNGGTADRNWAGLYFTNSLPVLEPGEAVQVQFDLRLYARDGITGMNWIDCFLTGDGQVFDGWLPSRFRHFGQLAWSEKRVGFRLSQTPWSCGTRLSDGGLSAALNPQRYWEYAGSIDLRDIGIADLGTPQADVSGDPLAVTYTAHKRDDDRHWACNLVISNQVNGHVWRVVQPIESKGASRSKQMVLAFNAHTRYSGGEGFELDNLSCRILKGADRPADLSGAGFESLLPIPADELLSAGESETLSSELAEASIPLWQIPAELRRIEQQHSALRAELATLPELTMPLQFDGYGYHGGYLPALDALPEKPRWSVDLTYPPYGSIRQLILIPALDRRFNELGSYGFPKRFRVLQVFSDGSTRVAKSWMQADCPDPGRMPLTINLPDPLSRALRLEVFRGDQDGEKEAFALDEIFSVVKQEVILSSDVAVSSDMEALPYWGKKFVSDQKSSLGLPSGPVGVADSYPNDFSVLFENKPAGPAVVELDLGKNRLLGKVFLYPAAPADGMLIPGYGFPGKIQLEVVPELSDGRRGDSFFPSEWIGENPGNNMVSLAGRSLTGRWVRLTVSDFPVHDGRHVFAMGEIRLSRLQKILPVTRVFLEGFPVDGGLDVGRLVDGLANGRPVMFLYDWLMQLDRRSQLTEQLEKGIEWKDELTGRWHHFLRMSGMAAVTVVVCIAVGVAVVAVFLRRKHARRLRQQITQDLHDDIGSRLSAMSLVSTYLQKVSDDTRVHEGSGEMDRMAREMQVALADVLWFTSSETDSLRQLVARLADVSEQMVPGELLDLDQTPLMQVPDSVVKVLIKRDLLLLFKEMLHNAVKHSAATTIHVDLLWLKHELTMSVVDNGRGFDVDQEKSRQRKRPNLGLNSMERRAKRLAGKLLIDSQPGKGCSITLTVRF